MRRSAYELYTLLVCFGALMGLLVALSWLMHGILSWSDPELMISSWNYEVHQTNDRFWQERIDRYSYKLDVKEQSRPMEEKVTQMRQISMESLIAGERRDGKKITLFAGFGLLVAGIVFAIHWRLAKQARQALDGPPSVPQAHP